MTPRLNRTLRDVAQLQSLICRQLQPHSTFGGDGNVRHFRVAFEMASFDKIFSSVFPVSSEVDVPTPAATPVLGSSDFGEAFASPNPSQASAESGAAEQVKWDRAWHAATTFLALPNEPIKTDQDENTLKGKWIKPCLPQTQRAMQYVLSEESWGRQLRKGTDDLLRWYFEDVVLGHYIEHVYPDLNKVFCTRALEIACG